MEELSNALFMDEIPEAWNAKAYPSMLGLGAWFADLVQRIKVKFHMHQISLSFVHAYDYM